MVTGKELVEEGDNAPLKVARYVPGCAMPTDELPFVCESELPFCVEVRSNSKALLFVTLADGVE